jgi:hypothetical protein
MAQLESAVLGAMEIHGDHSEATFVEELSEPFTDLIE